MKFNTVLKKGILGLVMAVGAVSASANPIPTFNMAGSGDFAMKYSGYTAPSADNGAGNFGSGLESTFGGGYVQSFVDANNPSNVFWQSSNATGVLSYMIYGIADSSATFSGGIYNLNNVGCTVGPNCDGKIHIAFYLDNTTAMGGTNPGFSGAGSVSPGSRVGNTLGALTDTPLLMDWVLVPGIVAGDPTTTLNQLVTSLTLPATGSGSFYAECDAGPACGIFKQAGQPDFFGQFTLTNSTKNIARNGWTGSTYDPVTGVIPEPASMLLFAAGLLGLAGAARRRKF